MNEKNEIAIVISGEAGQGLQTLEKLLPRMAKLNGFHAFTASEFMSRVRGGNNSSLIRISSARVRAAVSRIDVFIPLSAGSLDRFKPRLTKETLIYADPGAIGPEYAAAGLAARGIPFAEVSRGCGGGKCLNMVVLGFLTGLLRMPEETLREEMKKGLARLDDPSLEKNLAAAAKGYAAGAREAGSGGLGTALEPSEGIRNEPVIQGTQAVGIGALAGGCNFVSSYPMSPSSNLLEFMARNAADFGMVVEQAEDEISAVNMACGAWYAGGRALVTTSGGGFSLMTEGLSLAGCTETPLVIHLAQRPGPATGLPTRTEQGDFNLALYSGHGEFPRIIYAPGDFTQGMELACRAFTMADKYQVPVFILTDQYFLDSSYNMESMDAATLAERHFIVRTSPGYKRYLFTESGISPRGVPGWGDGTVCADSDEHTQEGFITEDSAVRTSMMDKRLRKLNGFREDEIPPSLIGDPDYRTLFVCWGSTLDLGREALRTSQARGVAILHFSQVHPLPSMTAEYLARAKRRVMIENNAGGQFGRYIEAETGMKFHSRVLSYGGRQFTVEEIAGALSGAEKP